MNRMFERSAAFFLSACCVILLNSCGGGVAGAPAPSPSAGTPLAVTPATADVLPGVPTTFTITGGAGGYTAFSSNTSTLPITSVTGSTFTVTPSAVTADTTIDITVRDVANASTAAKVTVKFKGTALAISPDTAVLFPDLATTFIVSGGVGPFTVVSSNSAVLPVTASVNGATFVVVPKVVTSDTAVDITVRDAANTTATAKITVKPSSLLNQITFTPFGPTGIGCGMNTVCSGGDAQIVVKAVQNGVVLANRQIRFDVFQGSYQLVTPGSGALVSSLLVNTDAQGEAVARITANVGATTQVATIQTTDVTSGLARRYNFTIVQQTSGVGILSSLPSAAITITGAKGAPGADGTCPIGATVDYFIYGGSPPYAVASPLTGVATVSPSSVGTSGGRFTATVAGCGKVAFIVTDASGRTIETSTLEALQGAKGDAVTSVAALTVTPSALTVACGASGSVAVSGSGSFFVLGEGGGGSGFTVSPGAGAIPNTVTIGASTGFMTSPVLLDFINGALKQRVTVTVTGIVSGRCP